MVFLIPPLSRRAPGVGVKPELRIAQRHNKREVNLYLPLTLPIPESEHGYILDVASMASLLCFYVFTSMSPVARCIGSIFTNLLRTFYDCLGRHSSLLADGSFTSHEAIPVAILEATCCSLVALEGIYTVGEP